MPNITRTDIYDVVSDRRKDDDIKVIIKYVKVDLFSKIKFIYDTKKDWEVGGRIYTNFRTTCRDSIGDRSQTDATIRELYMQSVWNQAMEEQVQNRALAPKRSAVYTQIRTKFSGKYDLELNRCEK